MPENGSNEPNGSGFTKQLSLPADPTWELGEVEVTESGELGEVEVTESGIEWRIGGKVIYRQTWEGWALMMFYSYPASTTPPIEP